MNKRVFVVEAGRNAYPFVSGSNFEVITHPEFSDRGAPNCVMPVFHPRGGDPDLMSVLRAFLDEGASLLVLVERSAGTASDLVGDYPPHLDRLLDACQGHGVIGSHTLEVLKKEYPHLIRICP